MTDPTCQRQVLPSAANTGEIIKGRHEVLFSQELFDKVQALVDASAGIGTQQRSAKR